MSVDTASGMNRVTEDVSLEATVTHLVPEKVFVIGFKEAEARPSVLQGKVYRGGNTGAGNVEFFRDGTDGKTIRIIGDGFTTVVHNVDLIITNTETDKLLTEGRVYVFTFVEDITAPERGRWIEQTGGGSGGPPGVPGSGAYTFQATAPITVGQVGNIVTYGINQAGLSIGWGQLTGVPATFPPSAHALNNGAVHTGLLDDSQLSANVPRKNAANIFTTDQTITNGSWRAQGATGGAIGYIAFVLGDANARFVISANGVLEWGPGGAVAMDTILFRDSANKLKTNGHFVVGATSRLIGNTDIDGQLTINSGAGALTLTAGALDYTFVAFYARTATPSVRSGYFGYIAGTTTEFSINNEIGLLKFLGIGAVELKVDGTDQLWVTSAGLNETALTVKRNTGGVFTMQRVSQGPIDTPNVGFRVLQIPN